MSVVIITSEAEIQNQITTEVELYPSDVVVNGYPFIGVKDDVINGNVISLIDVPIP